jgi:general stress protein YciG
VSEAGVSKKLRGFARMSAEKRTEIARRGGAAVSPENRSFARDRALAKASGEKGGRLVKPENRSFSKDRQLAIESGRKGGKARRKEPNEDRQRREASSAPASSG